jgi:hypothetical protein
VGIPTRDGVKARENFSKDNFAKLVTFSLTKGKIFYLQL